MTSKLATNGLLFSALMVAVSLPTGCVEEDEEWEPRALACKEYPTAHWRLDEREGPLAKDSSGKGNHGTYVGNPIMVWGAVFLGLSFDGNGDYVEVPSDGAINVGAGDFSLSYHIKTQSNALDVVLDKRVEDSGPTQGYVAYITNGRPSLQLATGFGHSNYSASGAISDGEWHHVLITVDRDQPNGGNFYIDGAWINSFNPTGRQGDLSTAKPLRLGRRSDTNWAGYLTGALDDVRLYRSVVDPLCIAD